MANIYEFSVKTIDGKDKTLADYKGKALLIVNVASKCGLTPQYKGLEELHEKYGPKGLVVLGFPANEFGAQEPGTESEIQRFCTANYGVKFDMMSKVVVKGAGIHPLFAYLTGSDTDPKFAGEIKWNFNKFLIGKDGTIVDRFEPKVEPLSLEVTKAVERAVS